MAVVATVVLASILPIPGKLEIKIVQSGSMEPTIKTGSLVIIKPENFYKTGDIITFGKDTKKEVPTTHRIVAERIENGEQVFKTQGDANEDPDTREIRKNEIIGKTIFDVPYFGYIVDFAKKPIGFVIFIVLPALYIAYDEAVKIFKEIRKMCDKKLKEDGTNQNL